MADENDTSSQGQEGSQGSQQQQQQQQQQNSNTDSGIVELPDPRPQILERTRRGSIEKREK